VFSYLAKNWLARFETRRLAAGLCMVNAVATVLVLEIVLHVPVSLELSWKNSLKLSELYLSTAIPFFFTGVLFSAVFARETRHITRLYGADLAGGAAACLGVVPLLNWIGGPNTIVFAGLMAAVAAAIWANTSGTKKFALALGGALLALIAANHSGKLIDVIYAKGMFRDPAWVEFARWNAISRVEVDRQGGAKAIVIDADASTYIMNADPRQWQRTAWRKNLMSAPPALANVLRPQGEFAIIGPGGGVDVLRAVANGSPSVTGIEINPIIANTIMRGRYADFAYHLYERPEVHIHVTDGRSFVRSSKQRFDVVQMTLVDTWASTAAGAFALSENNLYTVEAFREYFQHLKPDGMIAVTRWEFKQPREALRVVSVAMEALHSLGVADPSRNFVVVSEGDLDEDGIPVVVLAKRTAFTPEEESRVRAHLAAYPALFPLYLSSERDLILQQPLNSYTPGSDSFTQLIQLNNPRLFAERYPYNVAPVSDNAPFFFFTLKIRQILNEENLQQGIDWKVNLGVVVLGMVLVLSLAAVLAFLILPLLLRGERRRQRPLPLLYFVAIGLGYILVEIAFIQRFVLFLGHPTYALTVVIFLLLLSSGAGSLVSRRWILRTGRGWLPLALIIIALLIYVFVLPAALAAWVGLPFMLKLLISGTLLVPLGFAMGMPFPTGLRAVADVVSVETRLTASREADTQGPLTAPTHAKSCHDASNDNAVEWAWAMNAASSVLGSVLAMIIAIHFGLNFTLACGTFAYFLALALSPTLKPNRS
jgi:hypothetical protein